MEKWWNVPLAIFLIVILIPVGFTIGSYLAKLINTYLGGAESPVEPKPLEVIVRDAITKKEIQEGTVYILDKNYKVLGAYSITDGSIITDELYKPNEEVIIFVEAPDYYFRPEEITLPKSSGDTIKVTVYGYKIPDDEALTIRIQDYAGNVIASESYSGSVPFVDSSITIFIQISIQEKYGLMSYYDPLEGEDDDVVLWVVFNSTEVTTDEGVRKTIGGMTVIFFKIEELRTELTAPTTISITLTVHYSGSGALSLKAYICDKTDFETIQNTLAPDTDYTLYDYTMQGIIKK